MGNKLSEQPYKAITGFVVVVAVTTLVWWVIRQPGSKPATLPAAIVESIDTADEPETDIGTPVEQDEDTESAEGARQIVHVPDTRKQTAGIEELAASEVTGTNVAEFTAQVKSLLAVAIAVGGVLSPVTVTHCVDDKHNVTLSTIKKQ